MSYWSQCILDWLAATVKDMKDRYSLMKREAAERIVQAVMKIDHIFGELDGVFNLIDDAEEKNKMRRAFAMLLLDLHERVTLEVGNSILICIPKNKS
jgi:hypothetical protein